MLFTETIMERNSGAKEINLRMPFLIKVAILSSVVKFTLL